MQRRDFIKAIGASAAAWPLVASAQQPERMRRIGALLSVAADNAGYQARVGAFRQRLALLGWTIGGNLEIDIRWGNANTAEIQRHAAELAALAPDVILAAGTSTAGPLVQVTRTVPIVFTVAVDPVGAGLVDSLARPGGNATGFLSSEYGLGGKWLELLKQIAPGVTRVAVLRNSDIASGPAQFGVIQAAAPSLRVEVSPLNLRDAPEIERAVAAFAHSSNGGLIVTSSGLAQQHRDLIVTLAAYGPDYVDQFREAAGYVDRILRGEKPADLPVQAPTRYETVINLKTANTLGLEIPPTLLARADEVIE
jgi:putative ABC transport system substrate-binding protein